MVYSVSDAYCWDTTRRDVFILTAVVLSVWWLRIVDGERTEGRVCVCPEVHLVWNMEEHGDDSPITLIIRAPNQKYEDQPISCFLHWTVEKLKKHLTNVYPSKPVSVRACVRASVCASQSMWMWACGLRRCCVWVTCVFFACGSCPESRGSFTPDVFYRITSSSGTCFERYSSKTTTKSSVTRWKHAQV